MQTGVFNTRGKKITQALVAFQEAEINLKPFYLRLLELIAASCHAIAVWLFQDTKYNHHHLEHEVWRNEPPESHPLDPYRAPTAFSHGPYIALEQYPNGIADVVGYWAEARILGGVTVFDRGQTETEVSFASLECGSALGQKKKKGKETREYLKT